MNIENIIEKVGVLIFRFDDETNKEFNLFSILRSDHDEVNLHSQFIFELLKLKSSRSNTNIFLQDFLNILSIDNLDYDCALIFKEYQNIDILIKSKNQAVVIENKIYARDQDKQLARYYRIMKEEGFEDIKIVYLTLFGTEPSKESIGALDKPIDLISYDYHIREWISNAIAKSATIPTLRESLVMYLNLIDSLTGHSFSRRLIMETKDLIIKSKENLKSALLIAQSLTEAKIEIQNKFWNSLEDQLKKEYTIEADFSIDKISAFYNNKRNNKYYGITLIINMQNADAIRFRIELENNIYFGVLHNQKRNKELEKKLHEIDSNYISNDIWAGWKYPQTVDFDFVVFDSDNIQDLVDENTREKVILKLVDEIRMDIKQL